ncbi:uncharacterized protein LOC116413040 [Galleria mellonella]|uniref:Uncharacterized protein LOC116413040 n=1 Tax=Galleria mellonella TaxID=7137 RepID=A0A6J3BW29_GALME|nr:uncharacterized protein LOC116413040 [Galleria mellonella]
MIRGVHWFVIILGIFLISIQDTEESKRKSIQYFSTEHPCIVYRDPMVSGFVNITSRRHSRKDPFYYVDFHINLLVSIGNNVTISFYFFEFLTNQYKRGFIEMHMGLCDLIFKDKFFGTALKRHLNSTILEHCPLPKGDYHFHNMTIPLEQVPRGFPFTKGRIYANATITGTDKVVGSAYIDLELKTAWVEDAG